MNECSAEVRLQVVHPVPAFFVFQKKFLLLFSVHPEPNGRKVDKMLTLKKVKELVEHRCTVDCTPTCVASDCAAVCGGICT